MGAPPPASGATSRDDAANATGLGAGAGLGRIILLVLDNAGWHAAAGLKIPDDICLVYLPPFSPQLQPAETVWALVDEPIVNKRTATIAELDAKIARQCVALARRAARENPNAHRLPLVAKALGLPPLFAARPHDSECTAKGQGSPCGA